MSMTQPPLDAWASGRSYEPYVGRWSRLVARAFLDWLAVPDGSRWLDVGSGTGALASVILEKADPISVTGIDASEGYVAYASRHVADPRVDFHLGDAMALPFNDGQFDATVSGLVLNFVPDPARMIGEMARVTRSGRLVACYVWDYAGGMQLMRIFWDAAVALNPAARDLDEGHRFPLCRPEPLSDLFNSAGLRDVAVTAIDVPTVFRDFDDYWGPFLGGQGPAPGYTMSLSEERRADLRERVRGMLDIVEDGSIHLTARAWAVRGTR